MRLILHLCSRIQTKSSRLRYVNYGPCQIQYNYFSWYSGFNIQLNVSPLLLLVYRQIYVRYTPHLLRNTGHSSRSVLCQIWYRKMQYSYNSSSSGCNNPLNVNPTMLVILLQFNARYTPHLQPNSAQILEITLCQIWSRPNPIYLLFFLCRHQHSIECISAAIGGLSTNCYVSYTTFAFKYRAQYPVYAMPTLVPVKSNIFTVLVIQISIVNWTYLRPYWWYVGNSMRVILHICSQIQPKSSSLRYVKSGPGQIQYNYFSWYSVFNIQLNGSPLQLVVYRLIDACYTPHLLPNKARVLLCTLYQLWSRTNKIYLHFLIFRLQYSIERITSSDWWFIDKSMRVILHIRIQIQATISGFHYLNFGPGQIQ
jgi:hypothetical protein